MLAEQPDEVLGLKMSPFRQVGYTGEVTSMLQIYMSADHFGEGETRVLIEGFREDKTEWNSSDLRFTSKGNTLYAFLLRAPDNRVVHVKSIGADLAVKSVRLLGGGPLPFTQVYGVLTVQLPPQLPTGYINGIAIELG